MIDFAQFRHFSMGLATAVSLALSTAFPAQADTEFNEEGQPIAFFSPTDGRYPAFREAFFSVPRPIVVLDPVVIGNPEQYPENTTVEQIGPDKVRIQLRGLVFDVLADMVADNKADIKEVRIESNYRGTLAIIELDSADGTRGHPFREALQAGPTEALRPYPFGGRFDLDDIELRIQSGFNALTVTATNVNEKSATAQLAVRATVNREEMRYDIEADISNSVNIELYNPILVYINDPSVTPHNVHQQYAEINGHRVGLRIIDGQLQLDRPIIGLNKTPPDGMPNLVNVAGDPDHFHIRYGTHEAVFSWSYTSMVGPDQRTPIVKNGQGPD